MVSRCLRTSTVSSFDCVFLEVHASFGRSMRRMYFLKHYKSASLTRLAKPLYSAIHVGSIPISGFSIRFLSGE
mgnify:CR=1 FL=1